MKSLPVKAALILLFSIHSISWSQSWGPILPAGNGVDWTKAGVGGIPARPDICARLKPAAITDEINFALQTCHDGQTVLLAPGVYNIDGTIQVPSNVTLRGAGADLTILKAVGGSGGDVISLGTGDVPYEPLGILSGATAGSNEIELTSAAHLKPGMYFVIAEVNDPKFVSSSGSGGNCNWCDGWTDTGRLARGQIVQITAVHKNRVSISPALYSAYSNSPGAVPFQMSAQQAGVEDLQVYATNSNRTVNFGFHMCAYCWIKGVESNYADGDHVEIYWGFHDEVRDSYFSNAFLHRSGTRDSDIQVGYKTTASLVENNIVERTHAAITLAWGAAGNVVAYNYSTGEFDSDASDLAIGGIVFHGAHPQFNLLEGNVVTRIAEDALWGSSSHTTAFRNWIVGTNRICTQAAGRASITCGDASGHFGFQAARAVELSYLATSDSYIANVVGSAQMQSLRGRNDLLKQNASVEYPAQRKYDEVAYGWSFGYGSTSDDGNGSGCGGGLPPCHFPGISATSFLHDNYSNITQSVDWAAGLPRQLPASFYLAAKPEWWSRVPYPATGPDVSGGFGPKGYSYGNPAQACYLQVMRGVDGGQGGPLAFNPDRCYAPAGAALKGQ